MARLDMSIHEYFPKLSFSLDNHVDVHARILGSYRPVCIALMCKGGYSPALTYIPKPNPSKAQGGCCSIETEAVYGRVCRVVLV